MDVRFEPDRDRSEDGLVPGRMFERLKGDYPNATAFPAQELPYVADLDGVVRHRFSAEDGSRLFQVGSGVLSSNTLRYESYAVFREQVARVLEAAFGIFGSGTQSTTLRYINKLSLGARGLGDVLSADIVGLPPGLGTVSSQRVELLLLPPDPTVGRLVVAWALPVDDEPDRLLLDLQVRQDSRTFGDFKVLLQWLDEAHSLISSTFTSMIRTEFMESLR